MKEEEINRRIRYRKSWLRVPGECDLYRRGFSLSWLREIAVCVCSQGFQTLISKIGGIVRMRRIILYTALSGFFLTLILYGFLSQTVQAQKNGSGTVVGDPFNTFIGIQVGTDGRFNMGAFPNSSGGAGANSFDLLYRWPNSPWSSYSTIKINGVDNIYGSSGMVLLAPTDIDGRTNRSKWKVGDIEITQTLQLVINPQTGREDLGKISYLVTNTGTVSHTVGQRIMLDTEIAQNDGVPFRVPGVGIVRNEMEFLGSAIPDTFQAFFNVTSSDRTSVSILKTNVEILPDRLVLASWAEITNALFDYTINPSRSLTGDSAYAVYWSPRVLAAGASQTFTTYYGLANLNIDLQAPFALSVDGPSILSIVNNQYAPNPFDIVATAFNNGTVTVTNAQLTLNLPPGLSLVTGTATQTLGNLAVGQERQVTWRVQAAPQATPITFRYSVSASAMNAPSKSVERTITVPALFTVLCDRVLCFAAPTAWCNRLSFPTYSQKNFRVVIPGVNLNQPLPVFITSGQDTAINPLVRQYLGCGGYMRADLISRLIAHYVATQLDIQNQLPFWWAKLSKQPLGCHVITPMSMPGMTAPARALPATISGGPVTTLSDSSSLQDLYEATNWVITRGTTADQLALLTLYSQLNSCGRD